MATWSRCSGPSSARWRSWTSRRPTAGRWPPPRPTWPRRPRPPRFESMSPRILVADALAEDGLARLREAAEVEVRTKLPPAELIEAGAGADALGVRGRA